MRKAKLFPCYSKHYNMDVWGNETFWGAFTNSSLPLPFHLLPPKTLLTFIILRAFRPHTRVCVSVCVCFSGRKTPLIRCHVVLEAVTCQGPSRYLSVTTSLFSVCGWFGTLHLNTHICCSSVAWTTERSTIKMTPIVKYNKIQRCFRSSLTLGLDGQTAILNNYHIAKEPERVILHHITNTHA